MAPRLPAVVVVAAAILVGSNPAAAVPPPLQGAPPAAPVAAGEHGPEVAPPTRVRPAAGTVALTFDDGPHPRWTLPLLDLLDRHGVRATFFVVGHKVHAHPEIVREMARRGHSVQNHTWSHPYLTRLSDAAIAHELDRAGRAVAWATGIGPSCLRPPFGDVSRRVQAVAASAGLETVLWDIDPQEWRTHSVAATVAYLISRTRPGDVVLLHDTTGRVVLAALEVVIPALRSRGVGFDRICAPPLRDEPNPRRVTEIGELR